MSKQTINLSVGGGGPVHNEDDKAAEAITPGMLVNINASGDLIKHASASTAAAATFALERGEMGDSIDTDYAINDTVKVGHFGPGGRVYALVASGQNIQKGEHLDSAGNGTLKACAAGAASRVGRSLEELGAVTALTRVRCEVI